MKLVSSVHTILRQHLQRKNWCCPVRSILPHVLKHHFSFFISCQLNECFHRMKRRGPIRSRVSSRYVHMSDADDNRQRMSWKSSDLTVYFCQCPRKIQKKCFLQRIFSCLEPICKQPFKDSPFDDFCYAFNSNRKLMLVLPVLNTA